MYTQSKKKQKQQHNNILILALVRVQGTRKSSGKLSALHTWLKARKKWLDVAHAKKKNTKKKKNNVAVFKMSQSNGTLPSRTLRWIVMKYCICRGNKADMEVV